jgi:hypothetical protein
MTFAQRAEQLKTKRAELAEYFAKAKAAAGGDGYSMDDATLAEVRNRTAELETLADAHAEAAKLEAIEQRNREELEKLGQVERLPGLGDGRQTKDGGRQWDGSPAGYAQRKGLGDYFVESAAFKEYRGGAEGPVGVVPDFDLKTLFQTSAGWSPQTTRTRPFLVSPQERVMVVDLMPLTETGQAAVKYMEETTFTNNAAETAEAGTYPESALATTEQSVTVRKVAVSLPVTDEQFEDEPRARDYVNNRLDYQLRIRLDSQLLVGNGTAPNLLGVLNKSGINTQAKGTDPTPDAIYKAITLVRKNGFTEPTGLVMHPTDWQNLRLLRTADGIYIFGEPREEMLPRVFGLPLVVTTLETLGTAVLGDFAQFGELALRRGIEFQVTNAHSTFFVEGKQMIRADFRCAAIWYRNKAFSTVTGL